jgi:hypothetical protein
MIIQADKVFLRSVRLLKELKKEASFSFKSKSSFDLFVSLLKGIPVAFVSDENTLVVTANKELYHDDIDTPYFNIVYGNPNPAIVSSVLGKKVKSFAFYKAPCEKDAKGLALPDRSVKIREREIAIKNLSEQDVFRSYQYIKIASEYERSKYALGIDVLKKMLLDYHAIASNFGFQLINGRFTVNSCLLQLHLLGIEPPSKSLGALEFKKACYNLFQQNMSKYLHPEKILCKSDSNCFILLDPDKATLWAHWVHLASKHLTNIMACAIPYAKGVLEAKTWQERDRLKSLIPDEYSYVRRILDDLPAHLDITSLKEGILYVIFKYLSYKELLKASVPLEAFVQTSRQAEYSKGFLFESSSLEKLVEIYTYVGDSHKFTLTWVKESIKLNTDRKLEDMNYADMREVLKQKAKDTLSTCMPNKTNIKYLISNQICLNSLSLAFTKNNKKEFVSLCRSHYLLKENKYTYTGSIGDILQKIQEKHPLVLNSSNIEAVPMTSADLVSYFLNINILDHTCATNLSTKFLQDLYSYLYIPCKN